MLKIKQLISILVLLLIVGCDVVDRPYTEDESNPDEVGPFDKKVILNDFTAMYCVFCPTANEKSEALQNLYGKENVILIGTHVTQLADPRKEDELNFRTPTGDELFEKFGGQIGLPIGMVNRRIVTSGQQEQRLFRFGEWEPVILEESFKQPDMNMSLSLDYDEETRKLGIEVETEYISNGSINDFLAIYITEDSLVTIQKDGPDLIKDYVHNHVLRGSVNGTYGEQLSTTAPGSGEVISKDFTYDVPAEFNPKKLRVIAFVHDNNGSYEIRQAQAKYIYDQSK